MRMVGCPESEERRRAFVTLRRVGTEPELREELIMSMMSGEMAGRQLMRSLDGMGSSMQLEVFSPDRIIGNCAGVTGVNWDRD